MILASLPAQTTSSGRIEFGSARVRGTPRLLAHPSSVDLVLQDKAEFEEALAHASPVDVALHDKAEFDEPARTASDWRTLSCGTKRAR